MRMKITSVLSAIYIAQACYGQSPELVKDIYPGIDGSTPSFYTKVGDKVFFVANNGTNGQELWITDGTEMGTNLVFDFIPGSSTSWINGLTEMNGMLYLQGVNESNSDSELYKSDGTESGTILVKDINTSGSSYPSDFISFNGNLLFSADNGINGRELWVSDGTEIGTAMLVDIFPGTDSSDPNDFYEWNNELYFSADDGINGVELWKTDGTVTGTVLVKNISFGSSYPNKFCKAGSALYFIAETSGEGMELWKTDGTEAGTTLVKDIAPGPLTSSPDNLIEYNDQLFFTANDGSTGFELWKSNGTSIGTTLVKDIYDTPLQGLVEHLIVFDGLLFFSGRDAVNGKELWKSNGTEAGTVLVADIRVGPNSSSPLDFEIANGILYFVAYDDVNEQELWVTDGTEPGTYLYADLYPTGSSSPDQLISVQDVLLFTAENGSVGRELFKICPLIDNTVSIDGTELSSNAVMVSYQWVDCDNGNSPIAGATASSFTPTITGNYAVELTSLSTFGGCGSQLSECNLIDFTGIDEIQSLKLKVYPNPSNGELNISINSEISEVHILDLSGKIVSRTKGDGKSNFSLFTDVKQGVYLIKVTDAAGNLHITQWIKL